MEKPFISYAQNNEDVVLWRALQHVDNGRYVDVGANDPIQDSISKVFHDAGWSGVCVEPVPALAERIRTERPGSFLYEGVASAVSGAELTLHLVEGTGLSTLVDDIGQQHVAGGRVVNDVLVPSLRLDDILEMAGWAGEEIHLVTIDTEGAEADVLAGFDLARWKPWVLVVEATAPNSTEQVHSGWEPSVLAAGYEFCLFDGLSRYYVSHEQASSLAAMLSYPSCVFDNAIDHRVVEEVEELRQSLDDLRRSRDELLSQVIHWRSTALGVWSQAVTEARHAAHNAEALHRARTKVRSLKGRIREMETSRSWRMTRVVREATGTARRVSGRS